MISRLTFGLQVQTTCVHFIPDHTDVCTHTNTDTPFHVEEAKERGREGGRDGRRERQRDTARQEDRETEQERERDCQQLTSLPRTLWSQTLQFSLGFKDILTNYNSKLLITILVKNLKNQIKQLLPNLVQWKIEQRDRED